jgi:hypothetical protein
MNTLFEAIVKICKDKRQKAGCLVLCCLSDWVIQAGLLNIINNLRFEIIQHQQLDETKMQQVLRNLQHLKPPEMLDNKGV